MRPKVNTRSLEPSSPNSKSKSSPKSATGKQQRRSIRPKPSWVHQSLSNDSITRHHRSPYLSRHDFSPAVASKFTEPSKSPKVAMKKTVRKCYKKRKIWTLPPTSCIPPPASLDRHEGSEKCDTFKSQYRGLRTTIGDRISDSDRDKTFVIDSKTERHKRYGVSEYKNGGEQNETNELMQLLTESNPRQNPAYIISGTLTPERKLSSNDILKLFGELTNRQIMERYDSMESLMYDRKYVKPKHKHHKRRNNARMTTTKSRRAEHLSYNLSSYLYKNNGTKNYNISNTSSELHYVPAVEMYEQPFGVVVRRKIGYIDRNIEKGKVVFKYGKHGNSFEESKGTLKDDNPFMKETTNEANIETFFPLARKGIQNDNGASNKARTVLNAVSKNVKLNTHDEENASKSRSMLATPSRIQKNSDTHKLTIADIKKKLALLKFPIIVTNKNQCAPVTVQDYVAPQYETMPKIWQYMKGWSTNCNQDNMMPNKYLKLLQMQKDTTKGRKDTIEIINEKTQSSQRPGQRKLLYSANKANHEPINANFENKDLKILFQSQQNGAVETIKTLLPNSSPQVVKPDKILSAPISEKELFPEEKNILDVFMEHLKKYKDTDNSKGISNKQMTKPSKLIKFHENVQNKIESILEKLESNYFYDYNNWIENSPTMSRKSPLVKRKKTIVIPEPVDIKVTSWENTRNSEKSPNPESKSKILHSKPTNINTEFINNGLITFDNNTSIDNLGLSVKDGKVHGSNGLVQRKKTCQSESASAKASLQSETGHFTKSIKKYVSPTEINKAFVKSRRLIQKNFKNPPSTYNTDVKVAVNLEENVPMPKLSQSVNSVKAVITVPGFCEIPKKIVVKSLNGNEITIEDSCKEIILSFKTVMSLMSMTREESMILHEPPKSVDDNFSVSLLNAGPTKLFRANYQLCTVRLPEQICSLWPLFIEKIESGSCDIKTEFLNNSTDEKRSKVIIEGYNITKGRLHCDLKTIISSQKHGTISNDLDSYYHSDIDKLLCKVNVISFLEGYTPIERHLVVKMNTPDLKTCSSTLKINFNLLNQQIAFRFGQYYVNDEFSYLLYSRCKLITKNRLVRLHQENTTILTFSIPLKVLQNVIKLISSGYVQIMFSLMDLKKKIDKAQIIENTIKVKRPQALRKTVSDMGVKNENILIKINRWKNKSTSDVCEGYTRKSKQGKIQFIKEECSEGRPAKFNVDKINGIRDFMKIIGCAGGDASANTINGQLSERILEHLREFTIWSEDISQGQALLILLLSSKTVTRSFEKFRSALVNGIATKRISSSTELDQELLAVEQDADVDYKGDDGEIVEELYNIARKAASEQDRPFNAESIENAIDTLVNRKRKLNMSYLRVMAKYVGLGLVTGSDK